MTDDAAAKEATPLSPTELQSVYHSVNDAIFVHDRAGNIIDVNLAAAEMYGYSRSELRDGEVGPISSGEPPYTEENARENIKRAAEGETQTFEWQGQDSEGNVFWEEVSLSRTTIDGETRILAIVRDIDERKQYEEQIETQRDNLEVLNQVVRHDMRNDLQLITAYTEILKDHVDEDGQEALETILESADNAIELTKTARTLATVILQSETELQPVSLRKSIEDQLTAIRSTYPEAVLTVEGALPRTDVLANKLLGSVFRNLLKNAIQHSDKEVSKVTVSATVGTDHVTVRVADNGPGIPDDEKQTIFGKGKKSRDSSGAGMGLYLVHTLIEQYGGDIWIEDNDPDGAVFVVELPIVE